MVGYSSGQRGRIVNPLTMSSKVQILHPPPLLTICGRSSVARVPAFQAGCRGFESLRPLHGIDLGADVNYIYTTSHYYSNKHS